MATTITAGNATNGAAISSDNTGILELKTGTGAGTTALTLNASQNATLAGTLQVAGVATNMYPIVSGTAVTLTNQTSVDFTSIPSWAKRITVMFNGVSTNGTSNIQVQLGDSGGIETTGYTAGTSFAQAGNLTSAVNSTTGFIATISSAATNTNSGHILITNVSGNVWVASCNISTSTTYNYFGGGTKTLSDVLTQVRITTVNGTDTFDAGTINIMWE